MNIAPIQLPPQTPLPTTNTVVNPSCPKAPQKSPNLHWGHAIQSQVCRKLVFDEANDTKNTYKNDFSLKK